MYFEMRICIGSRAAYQPFQLADTCQNFSRLGLPGAQFGHERSFGYTYPQAERSDYMQIKNFSFGATAAIVTSMGLIIGLDAATATKATILSGLLIVAIADNLTDSLSVHIYQESERLEPRAAFHATLVHVPKLITAYYARFPAMLWRRPRSRRGFRPRQI